MHEFSKKHCDNLLKISRNKSVGTKQKGKPDVSLQEKETAKPNIVTQVGSIARYGYFIPGEVYRTSEVSKEFNTEYDPYLQKYAEYPFQEKIPMAPADNIVDKTGVKTSEINFNRKKRKKVKTCQICNVTLMTAPEYDSHMKSPQHIWKLKLSGMGVSAHFVKASTDLHTTDINEDPKSNQSSENYDLSSSNSVPEKSEAFPLLFCDVCDLLLNSSQQYNAHISGRAHMECIQKKAELKAKEEKLQNPAPNQLYCYSCKISLNNLIQYNEHKNGKKHKIKCRQLMREGITIPPEERLPEWVAPKANPNNALIYPKLYEKFVLEKQLDKDYEINNSIITSPPMAEAINIKDTGQKNNSLTLGTLSNQTLQHNNMEISFNYTINCKQRDETISTLPGITDKSDKSLSGCKNNNFVTAECLPTFQPLVTELANPFIEVQKTENVELPALNTKKLCEEEKTNFNSLNSNCIEAFESSKLLQLPEADQTHELEHANCVRNPIENLVVLKENEFMKCNICSDNFLLQSQFDSHLSTNGHFQKILELKLKGKSENQLLDIVLSDRNSIKPDKLGRCCCSICNITTNNIEEYEQHLKSIVHKYTHKDYKQKKMVEVKNIIQSNEQGTYFCVLCNEEFKSLLEFCQHLHFMKHRNNERAEKSKKLVARRKSQFLQKQKLKQSLKRAKFGSWRLKVDKNPGVRTKICGTATNLYTGSKAAIPNLEPLEPKIDSTKNVQIGVSEALTNKESKDEGKEKIIRVKSCRIKSSSKRNSFRSSTRDLNKSSLRKISSLVSAPWNRIPASSPSMFPLHFQYSRSLPPCNVMEYSNRFPYRNPHQIKSGYFHGRPPAFGNSYWNYRARWPRFSPNFR